ncbi:MAG: PEP-CTERM/exosortase system-associated acyltransferase [Rhodothalassiaceae bacterium]
MELIDVYNSMFQVVPCDNQELIRRCQRIRYQVYCVETGFLEVAGPRPVEVDEFDRHSVHSLLVHRESEMDAGTVRVILPEPDRPDFGFPVMGLSDEYRRLVEDQVDLRDAVEVSRFAISKDFRKRVTDTLYPDTNPNSDDQANQRRIIPTMTLGLMYAAVQMTRDAGCTHWLAVMEPTLIRLLDRFGLRFEKAGPPVEYHGKRQPVHRNLDELLAEVKERRPDVWSVMTGQRLNAIGLKGLPPRRDTDQVAMTPRPDWAGLPVTA